MSLKSIFAISSENNSNVHRTRKYFDTIVNIKKNSLTPESDEKRTAQRMNNNYYCVAASL
jgi:hypothetical protein